MYVFGGRKNTDYGSNNIIHAEYKSIDNDNDFKLYKFKYHYSGLLLALRKTMTVPISQNEILIVGSGSTKAHVFDG